MQRTSSIVVAAVAALGLGCGSSSATDPRTDARLSVTATPAGVEANGSNRLVRITVRNDGGAAVSVTGCPAAPAVFIERRAGLAWSDAGSYGSRCLSIYTMQTVTLAAGDRIETVITAGPAGRYRFVVPIGRDDSAPDLMLRSDAVELR